MRSPALETLVRLTICGCLLASCSSGAVGTPSPTAGPSRAPDGERRDNFIGIRAMGSAGTRLEISLESGRPVQASGWLEQGGMRWEFTTGCEAFASALAAFRDLPALKPGPINLQPNLPDAVPIPPQRRHGEGWVIQTSAFAPDWSANDIELRGPGGPYPYWVSDTVAAVKTCGPPSR